MASEQIKRRWEKMNDAVPAGATLESCFGAAGAGATSATLSGDFLEAIKEALPESGGAAVASMALGALNPAVGVAAFAVFLGARIAQQRRMRIDTRKAENQRAEIMNELEALAQSSAFEWSDVRQKLDEISERLGGGDPKPGWAENFDAGIERLSAEIAEVGAKIDIISPQVADIHAAVTGGRVRPAVAPFTVPPLSHNFIERAQITERIDDEFAKVRPGGLRLVALSAIGGYGKTMAANAYGHERSDEFPGGVLHLSLENDALQTALVRLAPPLGIQEDENVLDMVRNTLGAEKTLLILDNLPEEGEWSAMRGLLPGGECHVLITTRRRLLPEAQLIPMERFSPAEARELFARFSRDREAPEESVADEFTKLLGGLPVALSAVGAILRLSPSVAWSDYLETIRSLGPEDLPDLLPEVQAELGIDERRRASAVIRQAYDAISPAQRRAVDLAAQMPPGLVPRPWIEELLSRWGELPARPAADPVPVQVRAVDGLVELDILTPGDGENLLRLHPLWRAMFAATGDEKLLVEFLEERLNVVCGKEWYTPHCLTRHELRWELTPVAAAALLFGPADAGKAGRLGWAGAALQSVGRYGEAEPLLADALKLRREVLGDRHPDTLTSMNNLAALYESTGRYEEAEPLYDEVLKLRREVLGERHPDTLTSMNNLALLYQSAGRYEEAAPLVMETLEARREVLGVRHPHTLLSMNSLAVFYVNTGRHRKAEPLYLDALEARRMALGDRHPQTLTSMNNLARLYESTGRHSKAEALYVDALNVLRDDFGDGHPRTLMSMINLAGLYERARRYDEAERLLQDALKRCREVLGDRHPDTLLCMNNLAGLYRSTGQYAEAEPLFVEALKIRREVLGDRHPDTLLSMSNLAACRVLHGDREQGIALLLEAEKNSRHLDSGVQARAVILDWIHGLNLTPLP